jgi:hypothetical protein
MTSKIFITYNPKSLVEESTALRLQTISNLYGLTVLLPFRLGAGDVSSETKMRIKEATFVVSLCLDKLSKQQSLELSFANEQKKTIIIIYDKLNKNKKLFDGKKNVKEIAVDFTKTDDALHQIAEFLRVNLVKSTSRKVVKKRQDDSGLGVALLGIGLGLLAVWVLTNDD